MQLQVSQVFSMGVFKDDLFKIVFVVVATIMFRGKRDLAPWAVAIAAALASKWLIGRNWYIVIGGLAGGIYGALRDTHQKKRDVRQS